MHNKQTCKLDQPHPPLLAPQIFDGLRRCLLLFSLCKLYIWVLHVTHVAFNSCLGISNLPCACRQQQAIACLGNWRGRVGFSIQASLVLGFGSSPTPWSLVVSLGPEIVTPRQRPQELGACSRRLLNEQGSTPH